MASKLRGLPEHVIKEVSDAVRAGAEEVQTEAVTSIMSGERSGRTYKRGKKSHVASAPGEYPKSDSGNLVRHILIEMESRLAATVGSRSGVPYARILELGGYVRGRYFAARPWLSPSLKKVTPFIIRTIKAAVGRGIAKGAK